jgi:hypothetical protein
VAVAHYVILRKAGFAITFYYHPVGRCSYYGGRSIIVLSVGCKLITRLGLGRWSSRFLVVMSDEQQPVDYLVGSWSSPP